MRLSAVGSVIHKHRASQRSASSSVHLFKRILLRLSFPPSRYKGKHSAFTVHLVSKEEGDWKGVEGTRAASSAGRWPAAAGQSVREAKQGRAGGRGGAG